MRNKNKMVREKIRTNRAEGLKKTQGVLFFAKDQQVSSRILAVLSVGVSKEKVQVTKREAYQKEIMVYSKKDNKSHKQMVTRYRRVPTETFNKIEKYQIICGSNGKVGTWFNTCELYNNGKPKFNKNVGRRLSDAEFVEMYENQCAAFKAVFAKEYTEITGTMNAKGVK